jgi:hypothetical protein
VAVVDAIIRGNDRGSRLDYDGSRGRGGEADAVGSDVVDSVGQDLTDDLAISPRSLAQEARDFTSQSIAIQQLAHGAGVIDKFPLQLCRQRVPLHDQRRPQASQDMLLFRRQSRFAGLTGLWQRH